MSGVEERLGIVEVKIDEMDKRLTGEIGNVKKDVSYNRKLLDKIFGKLDVLSSNSSTIKGGIWGGKLVLFIMVSLCSLVTASVVLINFINK